MYGLWLTTRNQSPVAETYLNRLAFSNPFTQSQRENKTIRITISDKPMSICRELQNCNGKTGFSKRRTSCLESISTRRGSNKSRIKWPTRAGKPSIGKVGGSLKAKRKIIILMQLQCTRMRGIRASSSSSETERIDSLLFFSFYWKFMSNFILRTSCTYSKYFFIIYIVELI